MCTLAHNIVLIKNPTKLSADIKSVVYDVSKSLKAIVIFFNNFNNLHSVERSCVIVKHSHTVLVKIKID
jgi:hypothetical protein